MSTERTNKIQFTNLDLYSKEGWETFLQQRKDRAVRLSRKKDPGFADVALVLTRHPETGEPRPDGQYILAFYVTVFNSPNDVDKEIEDQKDGFALAVNSAAIAGAAIASVFRSESWVSMESVQPGGMPTGPRVQPRHDPNRLEAISLMTDHREFGAAGFGAIITPHKTKPWKREIGPWSKPGGIGGGRFSSFLPRPELIDDPVALWAAREYLKRRSEKIFEHAPEQGPVQ